jgi:PQQ enzyme repeat.
VPVTASNAQCIGAENESLPYKNAISEFEYNPCHIYDINYSIPTFSYTFKPIRVANTLENLAILGPITIYKNLAIVDLSADVNVSDEMNRSYYFGALVAINMSTGKRVWQRNFTNQLMTQPILQNGTLFVGTGSDFQFLGAGNIVVAINATNGNEYWGLPFLGQKMPTSIYYNKTLILQPSFSEHITILNSSTGGIIKEIDAGARDAMSSPAVVGDHAYFGAHNYSPPHSFFYSINLSSGAEQWITEFYNCGGGAEDTSPSIWGDIAVSSCVNGHSSNSSALSNSSTNANSKINVFLVGLYRNNGTVAWAYYEGYGKVPLRIMAPPTTAYKNTVYADSPSIGVLYAVNMTTGKREWSFRTGPTSGNANIIGNHIFIVNSTGTLFVLDLNGALYKSLNVGIPYGPSDVIEAGNKIVLYGTNGRIESIPLTSILG